MLYKIAVASSDGKVINQHFGRTETFYISEVNDNRSYHLLEERRIRAICMGGEHDASALNTIADKLADCKYVLVSQIGPGAEYVLNQKGVTVLVIRDYFDNAIQKLMEYDEKVNFIY
ncbi:NifB/NifX family molybdenum-iron cluster-binding protein [Anaerocolumna chitinilytica]|uniref:Dinitrogenase iron-molybdenum cofactor biosynthesis domain-containing protein n=1 Tax=Anaerocolumna chitinilytica TaxID=1727145 RepID=A0A7I8DLL6_9FIRM|nr:NifB/NifX family molybdenum-iron cluster-binding protein [Anaerocolumna chitinilytica]BCJ99343.1 hypothetical protein bsdcttw_23840 [Anaerocolumna chitinilytica]